MSPGADEGLLESNFDELNKLFYDAQPWVYFQHRLGHLALVAADSPIVDNALREGVDIGTIKITIPSGEVDEGEGPTPAQAFRAIEAEVLLHHCAETLLRFVHAHADGSPCPWLRMSRVRGAGEFKDWVDDEVRALSGPDREALCARVFALSRDGSAAHTADYLHLLAKHFLHAEPYNAAKHGMALNGGAAQLDLTVGEIDLISESGATVSWLATWPPRDPERPPRWTRFERFMSMEAMVSLIAMCTSLMQSLWMQGRHDHLGEDLTGGYAPPDPADLFAGTGLRHPVIADVLKPLDYEGVPGTVVVHSRHLNPPGGPSSPKD